MEKKHVLAILMALCLVLACVPVNQAAAAEESGSLWLRHLPTDGGVTMALVADTAIGSGVITITYDKDIYTFQGLTVDSAYVLAHAVNDKEAGTIKISWIGKGAESGAYVLMRLQFVVNFASAGNLNVELSGSVKNADGEEIAMTTLDFAMLNTAMAQAESLKAEDYTADSFAAVRSALAAANDQANVETVTQAQVDAATQALKTAMDNLVVYVPEPEPTDPTEPTEPAPTEPAPTQPAPTQPGSVPTQTQPAQGSTPAPAPQPQSDNGWILIVLAVLGVAAVAAAAVILKKRGRK